jgi:Protein of unknown function (DUF1269)
MAISSNKNTSTQVREVVGAFGTFESFGDAIEDLQSNVIDRARLTVLAGSPDLEKDLTARGFHRVKEILDLPDLPRRSLIEPESIAVAQGALVSGLLYVGVGVGALASGGAALAPLIGAMAAGGAVGGSVGGLLAYRLGSHRAHEIEKHLEHGGLALWVRVTPEDEDRVVELMKRHDGEEVHAIGVPDDCPAQKSA